MQSTRQAHFVQIHNLKTDFSGVDNRTDPYQQFVENMKDLRFLKFK